MHVILNIKNDEYLKREKSLAGELFILKKYSDRIKNYFI